MMDEKHSSGKKRCRSVNWDEEEKQLFRVILKDYAKIIENKCLKTNTNKEKSKAWAEVHKKFNELNCRPRELNHLQLQWKTMKMSARRNLSSFKKETSKTGGGPKPPSPSNGDIDIKDLLNEGELERDYNIFDSDGPSVTIDCKQLTISEGCDDNETCKEGFLFMNNKNVHTSRKLLEDSTSEAVIVIDNLTDEIQHQSLKIHANGNLAEDSRNTIIVIDNLPEETQKQQQSVEYTTPQKEPHAILAKKVPADDNMYVHVQLLLQIIKSKKTPASSIKKNCVNNKVNYVTEITSHSKNLKDMEFQRRMKMAEEEHAAKLNQHAEKLRCLQIEREILELKKEHTKKIMELELQSLINK